jgi:transcriptional regulator with XRE-family HTH domain
LTPREFGVPRMTGPALAKLMRQHNVTLKELSQRLGIPMTRIRRVLQSKLSHGPSVRDWVEAITGTDPGVMK